MIAMPVPREPLYYEFTLPDGSIHKGPAPALCLPVVTGRNEWSEMRQAMCPVFNELILKGRPVYE